MDRAGVPAERTGRHVRQRVGLAAGQEESGGERTDQAAFVLLEQRAWCRCRHDRPCRCARRARPRARRAACSRTADERWRPASATSSALRGARSRPSEPCSRTSLTISASSMSLTVVTMRFARVLGRGDDDLERDLGRVGECECGPRHLTNHLARRSAASVRQRRSREHRVQRLAVCGTDASTSRSAAITRSTELRSSSSESVLRGSEDATHRRGQRLEDLDPVADDAVDTLVDGGLDDGRASGLRRRCGRRPTRNVRRDFPGCAVRRCPPRQPG